MLKNKTFLLTIGLPPAPCFDIVKCYVSQEKLLEYSLDQTCSYPFCDLAMWAINYVRCPYGALFLIYNTDLYKVRVFVIPRAPYQPVVTKKERVGLLGGLKYMASHQIWCMTCNPQIVYWPFQFFPHFLRWKANLFFFKS